jgi:ribonuclease R
VGVVEYGFFVEELQTLSEGLVPVSSISGDYYVYDKEKFELKGERKGQKFRLGDKIAIKVVEADLENRTITFGLADKN